MDYSVEEYIESTGLDGTFGRIACIGFAFDDKPAETLFGPEGRMLKDFWSMAKKADLFIGFNVIDFDLRFLYQRSVILDVKPSKDLSFARYNNFPIFDVMQEWIKWNSRSRISLDTLAKALGLESSKGGPVEGKNVFKAYEQGRTEEIRRYCEKDVELTREIYKKMIFDKKEKQ
jgi:hypothetical protein